MPGDWFTCSRCRRRFRKAWTDEEARQEMEETYRPAVNKSLATLCEDCHGEFMNWLRANHPEWLR